MPGLVSPLPSERADFSGKLLNAAHRKKHVDNDAQLLANRIALLRKEEQRAWRKIQQTKKRADEIVHMRREHERKIEEKAKLAKRAEAKERRIAEENLKLEESARRARLKTIEAMYRKKRSDVQRVRQERQVNRAEARAQQQEEIQLKRERRAAIKKHEEDLKQQREDERIRIERENEQKYLARVREKEIEARRKEKEVSKLEKVEMQLIQKLKNTQQLQQQAFQELENALSGDV